METEVRGGQRTSGAAIASLILGIVGLTLVPLIPSILAIVFGGRARDEIRGDSAVSGEGLATAGIILGWIGVVLSVIGILFVVLAAAAVFAV